MTENTLSDDQERVKQAQENPQDAEPGVYTEIDEDEGRRSITIVPERPAGRDEDPRDVIGQRRLGDNWRAAGDRHDETGAQQTGDHRG